MNNYFNYNGNNGKITNILKKLNELLSSDSFYDRIKQKDGPYLYANCSGTVIANSIRAFRTPAEVVLYKSKNPWTSSNGYFTPSKPHTIHLNTRKLGRTNASIGATICHEIIHMVDAAELSFEFGHQGNTHTPEKEACAPFYIDNITEELLGGSPVQVFESRKISYVPVWYKRIFMPWTWLR